MQKLTILVDMDDTIEHLVEAWVAWLNNRYGTDVKAEDVTDWEVCKFFPSLTQSQVYRPLSEDGFWKTVKPIDGAAYNLLKLIEDGHDVYIVTASDYRTVCAKMEDLLFRHFPFITWDRVIFTVHKQMIKGDVLVDDGIHNLLGGDYLKILMSAPHNRGFDAIRNNIVPVENWDEVYSIISTYAELLDDRALPTL